MSKGTKFADIILEPDCEKSILSEDLTKRRDLCKKIEEKKLKNREKFLEDSKDFANKLIDDIENEIMYDKTKKMDFRLDNFIYKNPESFKTGDRIYNFDINIDKLMRERMTNNNIPVKDNKRIYGLHNKFKELGYIIYLQYEPYTYYSPNGCQLVYYISIDEMETEENFLKRQQAEKKRQQEEKKRRQQQQNCIIS